MTPTQLRGILARNIRHMAKRRKLGINALADFAGVSRSQLYDVLSRKAAASTDWLARVAKALDTEPWKLLVPDR